MSYLAWLVPLALGMGLAGLAAFLWSMRSGQYEDLDGAAERVLLADAADAPLRQERVEGRSGTGERTPSAERAVRRRRSHEEQS
jgi:cbb3-type cytochrome oxidase maturation protein